MGSTNPIDGHKSLVINIDNIKKVQILSSFDSDSVQTPYILDRWKIKSAVGLCYS